eukprot:3119206-Rhodomonas_salina.1
MAGADVGCVGGRCGAMRGVGPSRCSCDLPLFASLFLSVVRLAPFLSLSLFLALSCPHPPCWLSLVQGREMGHGEGGRERAGAVTEKEGESELDAKALGERKREGVKGERKRE